MEVSFVDERSYERRESILVSPPTPSPREVKSVELVAPDDEQEAEACEHFTIRGYVSGIRKRDAKICWPFFTFHNQTSDEYANSLPPLPVTKFRQWNCPNCLPKANAPAAAVANGALSRSPNDELNSAIVASHADEKILLPVVQQLSEEKIREGPLAEVDSSINLSNGQYLPSICCAKKATEPVITDLKTEGFQISNACHDSFEEIQNQSGDTPTSVITVGRAFQMGERGDRNAVQMLNTLGAVQCAHRVDASEMLGTKSKETELVNEIACSAMAADPTFMGNVALSGQKQCNDATRHLYDIDSVGSDENDYEASDKNNDLTDCTVQCQNHVSKVLNLDGKLHHKKARKVRLLDDIIRSEELCMMSKKVCSSNGDAKAAQTQDDVDRGPDASEGIDQQLDHKSHLANQKSKVEPIKSNTMHEALENEDEGPSLMYWLKKVNKDPVTRKGDAENKHINTAVVYSKSAADATIGKGLDLIHEGSGAKGNRPKDFLHRKQNEMPQVYPMPQQNFMTGKGLIVSEDAAIKTTHAKTLYSELKVITTTEKSPHHGPKNQDINHKKVIVNKKKNIEHQVEDNESSQIHLTKDSFSKYDHATMTGVQGQKKATKKRRTMRMHEKEALDDIPMDIVELLAKNQHERRLMDAKVGTATMHNFSEISDKMKGSNALDATGTHRNMVLDAVFNDLSQHKTLSNNTVNGINSNMNVDGRLTAVRSPSNGKQSIDMGLNRQDLIGASTGLPKLPQRRNQYATYVRPPKSNSKNHCFAQSYSWNRTGMQNSNSCHFDQAIAVQDSCRNAHGWSSVLKNVTPFGVKPRSIDADSNHMDILCHDSLPQRKLKAFARETNSLKLINQDGTLVNSKEQANVGSTVYPNEIMPAMHLLKLMDSATWSAASPHKSPDINHVGFIQESDFRSNDQGCGLIGSESRAKANEAPKHPSAIEHPVQGQHHGTSCKPFRPLPVIGVFGSLLQKEITTRSSNCGTQSGFKIGQSDGPASHENDEKESLDRSHTATHTRAINAQTPIFGDENIEQFSHPGCSVARNDTLQDNINSEESVVQPLQRRCGMEICIVNRNPADFTTLDEGNVYMIASEDRRPRHITPSEYLCRPNCTKGQKRRKVMKLATSKGLVRS